MADTKISALPGASTPLGGAEVVPVVQSSTTKNVSIDNLTAGRTVKVSGLQTPSNTGIFFFTDDGGTGYVLHGGTSGTPNLLKEYAGGLLQSTTDINGDKNIVGNLVIGTSGKGIDFSADGSAAGMTSELLDDYEEGTWTATFTAGTSGTITLQSTHQTGSYTKVGRLVTVTGQFIVDSVASPVGKLTIDGLPFAINNSGNEANTAAAITAFTFDTPLTATAIVARGVKGQSRIEVYRWANPSIDDVAANVKAGTQIYVSMSYIV